MSTHAIQALPSNSAGDAVVATHVSRALGRYATAGATFSTIRRLTMNMKYSPPLTTLALLSLAFAGCSSVTDLGVIELAPDVPKHIRVGDADWTFTKRRDATGKKKITAESTERQLTQKDILSSSAAPNAKIGSTTKEVIDLTGLPTGVEVTGYFGGKLARFTLKP